MVQLHLLPCYDTLVYLVRKLPGHWELCSHGVGDIYSPHSHTGRRKITLVWALCPGDLSAWELPGFCGVCTGG